MTQQEFWEIVVNSLRQTPIEQSNHRFEVNYDDEIMCRTEEDANCIADFLESMGFDVVHTSESDDEDFKWLLYID